MPHEGTPIRYGQKQPVWSRQQRVKNFAAPHMLIC